MKFQKLAPIFFVDLLLIIFVASSSSQPTASAMQATAAASAAPSGETITWVFVPSENSQTVLDNAQKLADLVSQKSGLKIKTVVATDYVGAVEAMCTGQAQIGSLATFAYVLASGQKCADVALVSVRNGSTSYRGQIIAKASSGIKVLADLKGKTFCRPDPASASGWIVPSITMKANGINPDTDLKQVVDVGGHDAVVENVYNGNCDAGATFDDARADLLKKYPDVQDKIAVVQYTASIPNDTVAFVPSFDPDKRATIVKALLDVVGDKANADLIKAVYNWTALKEAKDAFFDDFRQQLEAAGVKVETLLPKPKATPQATLGATMSATPAQ